MSAFGRGLQVGFLAVACVSATLTSTPATAARKAIEPTEEVLTMRLRGHVTIDVEGKVAAHEVTTPTTPELRSFVQQAIAHWRFKPYLQDGKPVPAKTPMELTLAGRPGADGKMALRIEKAVFSPKIDPYAAPEEKSKTASKQSPFSRRGLEGQVLVTVRFDDKGRVTDEAVLQSLLINVSGDPTALDATRKTLETYALSYAKSRTIQVQRRFAQDVRVGTLVFNFQDPDHSNLGKWQSETRGPRHVVPFAPVGSVVMDVSALEANTPEGAQPAVELVEGQGTAS